MYVQLNSHVRFLFLIVIGFTCQYSFGQWSTRLAWGNTYSSSATYLDVSYAVDAHQVCFGPKWAFSRTRLNDPSLGLALSYEYFFHHTAKISGFSFASIETLKDKRGSDRSIRFEEIYVGFGAQLNLCKSLSFSGLMGTGGYIETLNNQGDISKTKGLSYCTKFGLQYRF
jgi:hypothetical protein